MLRLFIEAGDRKQSRRILIFINCTNTRSCAIDVLLSFDCTHRIFTRSSPFAREQREYEDSSLKQKKKQTAVKSDENCFAPLEMFVEWWFHWRLFLMNFFFFVIFFPSLQSNIDFIPNVHQPFQLPANWKHQGRERQFSQQKKAFEND